MRHGEKPHDEHNSNLSDKGYDRAQALVKYIPETFGTPDYLFATSVSEHSCRPLETIMPLYKAGEAYLNIRFADDEYDQLVHHLLTHDDYADKNIVVCWHHGKIPALMGSMGAKPAHYPDPWDEKVFNLILKTTFRDNGEPIVEYVNTPF